MCFSPLGILLVDDDMLISSEDVEFAFNIWKVYCFVVRVIAGYCSMLKEQVGVAYNNTCMQPVHNRHMHGVCDWMIQYRPQFLTQQL